MTLFMKKLAKHLVILLIILTLLTLGIIYPFMYGEYDRLSMPLSTLIQGFGIIGLLLSALACFWLFSRANHTLFVKSSLYLSTFLAVILAFFAYLTAGLLFGIIILGCWILIFIGIRKNIKETTVKQLVSCMPWYLIVIPLFTLAIQLFMAKPVTGWSRDRSIANASDLIRDIENFKSRHGYYPKTLQAMYKDYSPKTAGVDKFHYLPYADSYNISFEQPRFLLDVIGTKEWVVYNPKDKHQVYSHTSWLLLLSPEESAQRQGWYATENTRHEHWKSFYFD